METRKRSVKVTKTFHGGHTFCSCDKFSEGTLPSKQDIIDQVLGEDHFFSMNAARVVAAELVMHWISSNVYSIHELTVAKKIFNMITEFKAVDHYPKKKLSKPSHVAEESQFVSDAEKLFDIFCENHQRRRELQKMYRLRMTPDDFLFYEDQKGPRKARCLHLEELLTSSDLRFRKRIDNKGGNQLPGPSQGGSGDASGSGYPIVLDGQSLFSDAEYSCSQCSESSSVSFSGASQPSLQNRMNFSNLAQIAERYQISNKAAGALANAVLIVVGLIIESRKTYVIDKSKLGRKRQKWCVCLWP